VLVNYVSIALGGQGGFFQLNTMLPVIAYNLLQSIDLLAGAADILARKCVQGIGANRERCGAYIEQSLALATYLVPSLGYDAAAAIAREAHATGQTIRGILVSKGIMTEEAVDALFREVHGKE
ncbi:MAG: aspartate ammonia-lyase, partial [Syntrophobacteraceae bacterium]|nr:aspartate ammonia-lyase [Syntrophobacteraceae bacterium]